MEDLEGKISDLNDRVQILEDTVRKLTDMVQPKPVPIEIIRCYKCHTMCAKNTMIYEWVDGNPCDATYDYVCSTCARSYK